MRRLALAALGGSILAFSMATSALAVAPPGTVTVDVEGCTFTVHIRLDQQWPVVGWKIKVFDAVNWNDGLTIFKGQSANAQNLDLGPFTAAPGHYNAIVDNEYPPDGSSDITDFVLTCTGGTTGSPSPSPTATPTAAPTESPSGGTGNVNGGGGVGSTNGGGTGNVNGGTGNVNGAVGGVSATLPPTDTVSAVAQATSDQSILPLIAGFAVLVIVFALATPARIFRRLGARARDRD